MASLRCLMGSSLLLKPITAKQVDPSFTMDVAGETLRAANTLKGWCESQENGRRLMLFSSEFVQDLIGTLNMTFTCTERECGGHAFSFKAYQNSHCSGCHSCDKQELLPSQLCINQRVIVDLMKYLSKAYMNTQPCNHALPQKYLTMKEALSMCCSKGPKQIKKDVNIKLTLLTVVNDFLGQRALSVVFRV